MPAPDPGGIDIEEYDDGGFSIVCEVWWHGNRDDDLGIAGRVARG